MKFITNRLLLVLAAFVLLGGGISQLFAQTRTVTRVAAVGNASYFVLDDGALYAAGVYPNWTGNAATVKITTGVKEVFAAVDRLFFLKTDGTLWALGNNSSGEFGNGTQTDSYKQPIQVAMDVVSVAPGADHTLFLKADASLWAAGANSYGQFGTGQTGSRPTLTPVKVASEVRAIAAGVWSSFFIKTDGSLWGAGFLYSSSYTQFLPAGVTSVQVKGSSVRFIQDSNLRRWPFSGMHTFDSGVSKAALGDSHLLYVKTNGSLWTEGNNEWSQFGNGTLTSAAYPLQIATGVAEAAAGAKHSFYLKTDGSLWAMGYNQYGELADGTTTERNTAIKLTQPAFTRQPAALSVSVGASAAFTPTVTSTGAATYQWSKDGSAISGATSASYTIASTTAASAGNYTLVATNWLGSTTSSAATLTVISPVSITTQPTAQTVIVGNTATFSVVATGSSPLTYQWSKDGVAISGATSATYSIAATSSANAGSYSVIVTNSVGSVTSAAATLTVNPAGVAPSITTQPTSQSVTASNSVTFSVVTTGTAPLTYQWSKNGTAIPGATAASLTFSSAAASDAGSYTVVVTNALGTVTSAAAVLTIYTPPTITVQPTAQAVVAGSTLTLSVTASGTGTLTYQWIKGDVAISGATSSTFSIANCRASDAGSYRVTVSITGASVTSSTVSVTVNTPPTITSQPVSALTYDYNFYVGSRQPVLYVSANGTAPLNYQWYKNGTAINGAIASSYTFSYDTVDQSGSYYVVVSNAAGSATSNSTTVAGQDFRLGPVAPE